MIEKSSLQKESGHSIVAIVLLVVAAATIGATGWYVGQRRHNASNTQDRVAVGSSPAATQSGLNTGSSDAASKEFTAKYEKASFTYPADWRLEKLSDDTGIQDDNGNKVGEENSKIVSPSGKLSVIWSHFDGAGGACDDAVPAGANDGACPESTVVDRTPVPGVRGLYVTWGYVTNDRKSYVPWMAVLDEHRAVSGRDVFEMYDPRAEDKRSVVFALGNDVFKGAGLPSYSTAAEAKKFFDGDEVKQARNILLSLKY